VLQFVTRDSGVDLFLHYYKSTKSPSGAFKASKRSLCVTQSLSLRVKRLVAAQIKVLTLDQALEECISVVWTLKTYKKPLLLVLHQF
jgi:hypothetical protein